MGIFFTFIFLPTILAIRGNIEQNQKYKTIRLALGKFHAYINNLLAPLQTSNGISVNKGLTCNKYIYSKDDEIQITILYAIIFGHREIHIIHYIMHFCCCVLRFSTYH